MGGDLCKPPEWFPAVTPLEVATLRADLSEAQERISVLNIQLDFERRHNDYLTDTFVLRGHSPERPRYGVRERCRRFLQELLAGPGRG